MLTQPTPSTEPAPTPQYQPARGAGRSMMLLACVVAIGLAVGFVYANRQRQQVAETLADATKQEASAPQIVDIVTARAAPASMRLSLPGETAAWYDSRIYARVSGYVAKWSVDIGDHVTKDQVLATIETPEIDAELQASKAKLVAANADVDVRQSEVDFAKSTYDRWRNSPQGVVSDQERESKKAAFIGANAQLASAKAQVALDQADIDRLTALTAFKQVKAPYDGVITQRDIDIGNLVTAGSTSSTSSLYQIVQDNPMRVFVAVPQSASAGLLKGNAQATITLSDGSGRQYEGKVDRTSRSINPQARTLRVEVDIPNPDSTLVPGMYVQAAFMLHSDTAVQVPAAAMLFRPGPTIAVVDNDVVQFRDVKIGVDNGGFVQIQSGLKEGEKIALNLSSQIAAGEKVDAKDVDRTEKKVAAE